MTLGDQFYRVAPATPLEGGAFALPDVVIDFTAREKALRTTDLDDATARLMGHDRETGRRPVGVSPYSSDARTEQEKREKEHQAFLVQVILEQQLREMLDDLYQQRERLYVQLTEIQEERQRLVEQLDAHNTSLERLNALRARMAKDGLPGRLNDGRFDDTELESVLKAYEQRTGNTVDRSDLSDVQRMLLIETRRIEAGRAETREDLGRVENEARGISDDINRIEQRIDDVEETIERSAEPEFSEKAQRQLDDFELASRAEQTGSTSGVYADQTVTRNGFGFGGGN